MSEPFQVDSSEKTLLIQHYQKARNTLTQQRAHAVLLFSQGYTPYQIAGMLYRTEKTVREWLNDFEQERIVSLFPRYTQNENAAKLTRKQKRHLKAILAQKPSRYGIPQEFWDISSLKSYVKAEFGVEYESDESYRLIFLLHNYSFHKPDTVDRHRDEKQIVKRMKEIKEEVDFYKQGTNWVVFAADESRIIWETEIRRLWLPRGEKAIIKVERKRKAQSFLGFLNLQTGEELLFGIPWQNEKEIIRVLEQLVKKYPDKNILIVWDNASFHKGKLLREKLKTILRRIYLINLPPYAPDYNPQEHVWKYGKDKLANQQRDSLEETVAAFTTIVTGRKYTYQI